jgi:hypothetical protein
MPRAAGAGDSATLVAGGQGPSLAVLQAIDLSASTLEPAAGVYRLTAADASRPTATLAAAGGEAAATLAVDADGDGGDDGSISVPWDFVF